MGQQHPALYFLVLSTPGEVIEETIGIREVNVDGNVLLLNGKQLNSAVSIAMIRIL